MMTIIMLIKIVIMITIKSIMTLIMTILLLLLLLLLIMMMMIIMMDGVFRLFDSPKTKPHTTDWLRKDVDDPALLTAKKSLINKLDQIASQLEENC